MCLHRFALILQYIFNSVRVKHLKKVCNKLLSGKPRRLQEIFDPALRHEPP
jgi:hypothetical protein